MKHLLLALIGISLLATVLIVWIIRMHPPTAPTAQPQLIYSDEYPQKVSWIDNQRLLLQTTTSVSAYDTEFHMSTTYFHDSDSVVLDSIATEKRTSLAISRNNSVEIKELTKTNEHTQSFTFDNPTTGIMSESMACIATLTMISSPEDIATTVIIISRTDNTWSIVHTLRTSLSLIPITCNSSSSFLIPASPVLEPTLYRWNFNESQPTMVHVPDIENQKIVEIITAHKCIGIRTSSSIITIPSSKNNHLPITSSDMQTFHIPSTIQTDIWSMTSSCEPILLQQDSLIRFEPSRNPYDWKDIPNLSHETFVSLLPSPDNTRTALQSASGELWILQDRKIR